jgi:C4-type Zn-finger protein
MSASARGLNGSKYLQRSCPKCKGYLGIVIPEQKVKMPVQAINGRCLKCGYRLAWALVLGKRPTRYSEWPSFDLSCFHDV